MIGYVMTEKEKAETAKEASEAIVKFFTEDYSYAELQSCIIEGCKAMFFSIEIENPTQADEYGRMVQASQEALKLLRPFARIAGQAE